MKILKRKDPPKLICKCPHCGSKLEIEKGDIWFHKDIDGGSSPYVTCAVCKKGFDIEGYNGIQKLL